MKWRQEEEKKIFDPNYYPPEPKVPSHEEQPPTLVKDLTPAKENSRDVMQNEGKSKIEE